MRNQLFLVAVFFCELGAQIVLPNSLYLGYYLAGLGLLFALAAFLWPEKKTSKEIISIHGQWASVHEFYLWQAACLWEELAPYPNIKPSDKAYPVLQMLLRDCKSGKLIKHSESAPGQSDSYIMVSRLVLEAYAKEKGCYPRFLFPSSAPVMVD